MEELLLIAGFGIIALIAMSQCAHHSSRCHERLDLGQGTPMKSERAQKWNHVAASVDVSNEPTRCQSTDREPCEK